MICQLCGQGLSRMTAFHLKSRNCKDYEESGKSPRRLSVAEYWQIFPEGDERKPCSSTSSQSKPHKSKLARILNICEQDLLAEIEEVNVAMGELIQRRNMLMGLLQIKRGKFFANDSDIVGLAEHPNDDVVEQERPQTLSMVLNALQKIGNCSLAVAAGAL